MAVFCIVTVIVFVVLNPAQKVREQHDAQRSFDVASIAAAIHNAQVSNGGRHIATVSLLSANTVYAIGTRKENCSRLCGNVTTQTACVDLSPLVDGQYIDAIPSDPTTGNADVTNYVLMRNINNSVTVSACNPETQAEITVTR